MLSVWNAFAGVNGRREGYKKRKGLKNKLQELVPKITGKHFKMKSSHFGRCALAIVLCCSLTGCGGVKCSGQNCTPIQIIGVIVSVVIGSGSGSGGGTPIQTPTTDAGQCAAARQQFSMDETIPITVSTASCTGQSSCEFQYRIDNLTMNKPFQGKLSIPAGDVMKTTTFQLTEHGAHQLTLNVNNKELICPIITPIGDVVTYNFDVNGLSKFKSAEYLALATKAYSSQLALDYKSATSATDPIPSKVILGLQQAAIFSSYTHAPGICGGITIQNTGDPKNPLPTDKFTILLGEEIKDKDTYDDKEKNTRLYLYPNSNNDQAPIVPDQVLFGLFVACGSAFQGDEGRSVTKMAVEDLENIPKRIGARCTGGFQKVVPVGDIDTNNDGTLEFYDETRNVVLKFTEKFWGKVSTGMTLSDALNQTRIEIEDYLTQAGYGEHSTIDTGPWKGINSLTAFGNCNISLSPPRYDN